MRHESDGIPSRGFGIKHVKDLRGPVSIGEKREESRKQWKRKPGRWREATSYRGIA